MGTDPVLTSSLHLLSTCGSLEAMARMWESGGYCSTLGICSDLVFKVAWGKPDRFLEWVHPVGGACTAWSCLRFLASCSCVCHQQEKFTVPLSLCDLLKKKKK